MPQIFQLSWLIHFVWVHVPSRLFSWSSLFTRLEHVGLWIAVTQFSISGHGVLPRKENCLHRWLFTGTCFFPKCVLTPSINLHREIFGSADRFLLADPHVWNPIWSLKFWMDMESAWIVYTLSILTCFLPTVIFFPFQMISWPVFCSLKLPLTKDRSKIKSSEVPKPHSYPVGFKNKFLYRKWIK